MTTHHIGRIVVGCLAGGLAVALALVVGPLAGAQEHVITGTVLLASASSWALLATLSILWTTQPQRWAVLPAAFLGLAGAGLIAFAPGGDVIDALGWVWPPLLLALLAWTVVRVRRDLNSRTRFWVMYPLLGVYALSALGGGYQTSQEARDRRMYPAPGQLIDVGGHRLHLQCAGTGAPTVVLESGLGETAAYWGWIAPTVARDTTVCVYDRAGRGWSEPAPLPQDGVAVATDLHVLLERGHVPGPYVLVGHSSGAQYVRIFAGRYPEQVAGMVLLDGQPAEVFESLPDFPAFYGKFRRIFPLLPSLARLGVGRLVYHANDLPEVARDMQRVNHSSARLYRSLADEFAELPTSLAQARSFQNLGDRPLVIVTAERNAMAGWLPLQEKMATLSTNSSHRVVPYTHDALVTDQPAAQTSSQAIRDVITAVRSAAPLSTHTRSSLQAVDTDAVDTYIRSSMRTARIPGLALGVVRGERVAYVKGYGIAAPDGRPVTSQTPFILGSTSKSITALAVMQLVEAGKIDLDAPVTRYLPWFRTQNAAESAKISVRHLLHQTSGLETYEGRQGLWDTDQSRMALENGIRELSRAQLRQPAGQRYEYANENYDTLGLIVQTVSGTSYEEYVRSAIFAPLQMSHSAAALSDAAAADVASGYRHWLLWPVAFDAPYPRRMTPAGFLISSAEDMAHYVAAQLNGGTYEHRQLLSPQGISTLHTPVSTMGPANSYGMGWAIHGGAGATKIWHDGDVSNFHSNLLLLRDQHLGVVVLMNVGGSGNSTAINSLVDGIAATLLGRRPAAPTRSRWMALSRLTILVPLLATVLWAGWSFRSLRRWLPRGEASPQAYSRFWRLYVPLAVELGSIGVIWISVPAAVQTPMTAIALFAPDTFVVLVTITGLAVGCAIARMIIVFRPGRVTREMTFGRAAALFYAAVSVGIVAFQIALAAGAPWGAYAMGGAFPGQFPLALRIAALAQVVLIAGMAAVVMSRAGLMFAGRSAASRWLVWPVVAIAAGSLVLNLITPSAGERAVWAPVALLLLASSAVVAIEGVSRARKARGAFTAITPAADLAVSTMQAMTQSRYGSPEVLSLRTIARPEPGPRDVLVRVEAAGLHIGDSFGVRGAPLLMRLATGLFRPKPGVPGFDLSGVVATVGSSVTAFRPGDAVFGVGHGTCAEYAVVPDVQLALKPTDLIFEQAAAVPTSALAALHGLRDAGQLKRGQRVLINGAAGGVGTFAIQIAKAFGAEVTAVCGTSNVELVRSIGADHVVDYTREDFTRAPQSYDLVFDNVENRSVAECRRALTPTGTLILNSGSGGKGLALLVRLLWPLVLSPFVRHNIRRYLSKPNRADLGVLRDLLESRVCRSVIDRTFPLRETAAALRYIETGHTRGKVVITVG